MTNPFNSQSVVIDELQNQQEVLVQQNGMGNRMPTSQKGLMIALGIYSFCTVCAAVTQFLKPDPPSTLPPFVDSSVVAKHSQKWSFILISLATITATMLYGRYFVQRGKHEAESPITPEINSIIKRHVEKEMKNTISESSG